MRSPFQNEALPYDEEDDFVEVRGGFDELLNASNMLEFIWERVQQAPLQLSDLQKMLGLAEWLRQTCSTTNQFNLLVASAPQDPKQCANLEIKKRYHWSNTRWPGPHSDIPTQHISVLPPVQSQQLVHDVWVHKEKWRRMVQPERCQFSLEDMMSAEDCRRVGYVATDALRHWLLDVSGARLLVRNNIANPTQKCFEATQWLAAQDDQDLMDFVGSPEALKIHVQMYARSHGMSASGIEVCFQSLTDAARTQRVHRDLDQTTDVGSALVVRRRSL